MGSTDLDLELVGIAVPTPVKKVSGVRYSRRAEAWGPIRRLLWWSAWLFALPWALVVGLVGVVLCATVILIPVGMVLVTLGGLPGATLLALKMDKKEVRD